MTQGKGATSKGGLFIDWKLGTAGPSEELYSSLRPQSLAVLKVLTDNIGNVVGKGQLMAAVWPGVAVTDDSLVQCITEIRKAIGDSNHTLIKTLPKRGYIYQPELPAGFSNSQTLSRRNIWMLGAAALAIVAGLVTAQILHDPAAHVVKLPTIAVLPFANLGVDPKGDKFSDMMTEDVITDLSHSKDFAVIARNSSDVYKGKAVDIRTVGRELNVDYVLEGSVEALPGRVRATAQLIDPVTNTHIWSGRFEAPGDDVFALEAEITNRIATSILGHDAVAANNERNLIRRKPTSQWSAYEAYQAGLEASHLMSPDSVLTAQEMFARSIAIDPNFARAHVGMAWVHLLKILFGKEAPEFAIGAMLAEAKTAISLDGDDGEAHAALAQAYSLLHDQPNMLLEAERALKLAPNNADVLVITALFLAQSGKSDVAVANIENALRLNPNYPFFYNTSLFPTYFYAGDYAKSYEFAKEAAKAAPVNSDFLAMNAAYLGKSEEAAQARKALLDNDPVWSVERLLTNFGNLIGAKELERLKTGAEKAGLPKCMSKAERAEMPNAIHFAECDAERARG